MNLSTRFNRDTHWREKPVTSIVFGGQNKSKSRDGTSSIFTLSFCRIKRNLRSFQHSISKFSEMPTPLMVKCTTRSAAGAKFNSNPNCAGSSFAWLDSFALVCGRHHPWIEWWTDRTNCQMLNMQRKFDFRKPRSTRVRLDGLSARLSVWQLGGTSACRVW